MSKIYIEPRDYITESMKKILEKGDTNLEKKTDKENSKKIDETVKSDNIKFYTVPKTEQGINLFLDLFWGFHDFRIYELHYFPKNDFIDLILEYDSRKLKILLRFEGSPHMNYVWQDFEADWMYEASIYKSAHNKMFLVASEEFTETDELPEKIFWVSADKIIWTIVDNDCKPKTFSFKDLHPSWISKKQIDSGEYEINEEAFKELLD